MRQSSHLLPVLPPCALLGLALMLLPAHPAFAQHRYRVAKPENFRREPGPDGRRLGMILANAELSGGEPQDGWVEIKLEGFIWAPSVSPTSRDGFDLAVTATGGENLRQTPNGNVIARLERGFLLREGTRRERWIQVSRSGWMWARSLVPLDAEDAAEPADPGGSDGGSRLPVPPEGPVALDRAQLAVPGGLLQVPGGDTTGTLFAETGVQVLARSGEWARVRIEGWVRGSELRPASGNVLVGVSGAEVRAQPRQFEGKLLQWRMQFINIQDADELRPDIPPGTPFLLARGPLPEAGFLYVILKPEHLAKVRALDPLAEMLTIVRVRKGKSTYVGNPILELVDLSVGER